MDEFRNRSFDPEASQYYVMAYKEANFWTVKTFYLKTRTIEMKGQFGDDSFEVKEGVFTFYYPNGKLAQKRRYVHDKIEGLSKSYDSLGHLLDSAYYLHGIPYKAHYSWHDNQQLSFKGIYDDSGRGTGQEWLYHRNGKLRAIGIRSEGYQKDSTWTYFYSSGTISAQEYFNKGLRKNMECFSEDGRWEPGACDSFTAPVFLKAGGDFSIYITNQLVFPPGYKIEGNGKVIAEFFIEEDGTIGDLRLSKGLHPVFDREVIYTIKKSPKWIPAKEYNHPVRYRYTHSIVFY